MKLLAGILAFALCATSALADANAKANELFVEAVQLWKRAEDVEGEKIGLLAKKLALLQRVDANLDSIVSDYPSSNLAVQLMIGEVGPLEVEQVKALVVEVERLCFDEIQLCVGGLVQEAVHSIEDAQSRVWVMSIAQAVSGDFEAALITVTSIEDSDGRAWALSEVQAVSGNFEAALEAARDIEDADSKGWALSKAQAVSGDFEAALESARSIENADWRATALSEVQAVSGNFEAALEAARDIGSVALRDTVFAEVQAASGNLPEALVTANSIEYAFDKAYALLAIMQIISEK